MIQYRILDQDGNAFDIDNPTFTILEDTISISADIVEKSFRDGADFPGIQRAGSKILNFQYEVYNNMQNWRTISNTYIKWFRNARVLQDLTNNLEIQVIQTENGISHTPGAQNNVSFNTVSFKTLRPFWEEITENIVSESGSVNQIVIINDGYYETPPTITIQTDLAIPKFIIKIEETGDGIIVNDLEFGQIGLSTYIIDNRNGEIELNEIDRKSKIKAGTGFFNLQTGINTIIFEAINPADISISWKRRYFV